MRFTPLPTITILFFAAAAAFAQTPTFSVVDTTSLNATFGNAGKGVVEPQVKGFVGVAFGNGIFVAMGQGIGESAFRWATSTDGTTWTGRNQAMPSGTTSNGASKVHFINGKFITFIGAANNGFGESYCYTSTDGLTWTGNKILSASLGVVEFDGSSSLYVVAGTNGAQLTSPDLVTWTSHPVVATGGVYSHDDLAYFNGKFFSTINGFGGAAYSSADGVTWTQLTALSYPGGPSVEAGNGFLLATFGGSQYKSTDGATFTKLTLTAPTNWFPPGGSPRYTSAGFVAMGTDFSNGKTAYMVSADCVGWTPVAYIPANPAPGTGFISRAYSYVDIAYGAGRFVIVGADTSQAAFSIVNLPAIMTVAASSVPAIPTTLTATVGAGATVQWQRNGTNVSGATSASLSLASVQSADAGLYGAVVTTGGTATTQPFIVGVSSAAKVVGTGDELQPVDIRHPNGNIFDQILLSGAAATITADAGQATRVSYIDLTNDIVQIEFSGAGTLSIILDNSFGPAQPANYNQAVNYMKGHAGIVIAGADETTNVSAFSVGRATAFDPTGTYNILLAPSATNVPANNGSSLFVGHTTTSYDGLADLAFIAISSTNGKFGGIRAANASFFATKGFTGIYAPGIAFSGPVFIGDINASNSAAPVLVIGSSPDTRITGGDLLQTNGQAVAVAGLTQLKFTAGTTSHGATLPAQVNQAVLRQSGADVTAQVVVNP